MMLETFLIFDVICVFAKMVTANPLMQSIQPCAIANYQQNIYRQPYSEAFIIQPRNNNPYSQQLVVQSPVSTFQPPQLSFKDQINQIYWEKVFSNPTLRSILEQNNVINSQNVQEIPVNVPNTCSRGVVNNYIIVPPEYVKVNETSPKDNQARRNLKCSKNAQASTNSRRTMLPSTKCIRKDVPSTAKPRKVKPSTAKKKSNHSGNIKCYTPADVLEDRNSNFDYRKPKNEEAIKESGGNIPTKAVPSSNVIKNKVQKQRPKSRKAKKNKSKKKSSKVDPNNCKENIVESISSKPNRKKKQLKPVSEGCDCEQQKHRNVKIINEPDIPQTCDKDLDDIFNLKKDCVHLENRQTRNSKNDGVAKYYQTMYPNLPDDISKTFVSYISDFYNQVPNSNLFSGNNMYPYDLSQIYQMPKYSNTGTKSRGSKGKKKKNRRRKNQKKKNTTKNKKDNVNKDSLENSKTNKTMDSKPEIDVSSETLTTDPPVTVTTEKASTKMPEIATTEPYASEEAYYESFEEPFHQFEEIKGLGAYDQNDKNISTEDPGKELILTKEAYDTQRPATVNLNKTAEIESEIDENDESMYEFPELGSEDEIPNLFDNRLLEDYYPDFTRDNHDYLESREEVDVRNIPSRYFYTTDKNMDLKEIRSDSPNKEIHIERETIIFNDGSLKTEKHTKPRIKDSSEEIIFRTPPGLDFPDFITRKVNKEKQDSNEIYYQQNDNDFDRFNFNDFDSYADRSDHSYKTADRYINPNDKGSVVETVYARSKVVKYGQFQNTEKPSKPKDEDRLHNDVDKTVVIAKSISPDAWTY